MFDKQLLATFDKDEACRAHIVQFAALYLFGVNTLAPPVRPTDAKGGKGGKPIQSQYNVGVKQYFEFLTV